MLSKYKLLLLDADNTLLDFDAAERHALSATFSDCGWEYNENIYAFYHKCNDELWKDLEKGLVTRSQLKILRFQRTGEWMKQQKYTLPEKIDYLSMCDLYIKHLGECGKLLDGADKFCAAAKEQYRLCIVTNGTASVQYSRMKLSGLETYFEHLFISEEIGAEKPSAQFFDKVFETYPEISKPQILLIGDSVSSDMKGAYNTGIDSCFINKAPAPKNIPITYHVTSFDELKNILL